MSSQIVVLNDGETFTDIRGCAIYEVPSSLDGEGIEDALKDGSLTKLTDLRERGIRGSALQALRGLGISSLSSGDEFAVLLSNGAVFFTGGFDDIDSLSKSISNDDSIAGAFAPGTSEWIHTSLAASDVIAISDLRGTTEDE